MSANLPDRSWDVERIFSAAGIAERVISARQTRWIKLDGSVNVDFWNMPWLRRRVPRAQATIVPKP